MNQHELEEARRALSVVLRRLDVIDQKQVADLLNWSQGKVATYVGRGKVPEPFFRLSGKPLWLRKQIELAIKSGRIEKGGR